MPIILRKLLCFNYCHSFISLVSSTIEFNNSSTLVHHKTNTPWGCFFYGMIGRLELAKSASSPKLSGVRKYTVVRSTERAGRQRGKVFPSCQSGQRIAKQYFRKAHHKTPPCGGINIPNFILIYCFWNFCNLSK